eukprot:3338564-Rhodomonas_salina.1
MERVHRITLFSKVYLDQPWIQLYASVQRYLLKFVPLKEYQSSFELESLSVPPRLSSSNQVAMQVAFKGVCANCNTPVTSMHLRQKLPDGSYVHAANPNGTCNLTVQMEAEPSGDALPVPSNDQSEQKVYSNAVALVKPSDAGAWSAPVESRGMCTRCHQPVYTNQQRARNEDGSYAHHVDGANGKCNLAALNPLQSQPSGANLMQPHQLFPGSAAPTPRSAVSQPAGANIPPSQNSNGSAADANEVVEIRGLCRRCNQNVFTNQQRSRLADGTYEHVLGPDG